MADFSVTISNTINAFGNGPSTKWNLFSWGGANWGQGSVDLQTDVIKALSESFTLSDALTITADFVWTLSNELTPTFEASNETLSDAAGYDYVFVGGTSNASDRAATSYTAGSAGATTWASSSTVSTSWS